MEKKLLSVIVAAYNVEDYITKCIDSLISQTYKEVEILIVNDGSTDNTLNLLKRYKEFKRVKILNKENGGLSSARNYGIKHSKGEFITFVDADDYLEKDAYEFAIQKIDQDKSEMCIFEFLKIYQKRNKRIKLNNELYTGNFLKKIFSKSEEASIVVWNKIFRNDIIKKNEILFENRAFFEDTGFIFRYLYFTRQISVLNKPLYNYVQRDGSITRKINYIILDSLKNTSNIIEEFYREKGLIGKYEKGINDMNLRMKIFTYRYLKRNKVDAVFNFSCWNILVNTRIPIKHKIYLLYIKLIQIVCNKDRISID